MKKYLLIAAAFLSFASASHASSVAVGPNISTLGVGGEVPFKLTRSLILRLGGNYFENTLSQALDGIDYDVGLRLASAGASIDFHPFRNGLLVALGYFWNGNILKLRAAPTSNVKIGNATYTPSQVGSMNGKLEFDRFVPFVGLGYDNTFYTRGRWSFNFRAGAVFMGDANVSLTANGSAAGNPTFEADLQRESNNLEDTLQAVGILPVVTLGVKYRF